MPMWSWTARSSRLTGWPRTGLLFRQAQEARDEPAGHCQSHGDILWVSGALPGSVHDKKAEWIWGVLAELEAAGLVTLADKGYQGSTYAKIPYRGKNKPESQNRRTALTRSSARPASGRMPSSRPGKFSGSCAAAHGAPVSSPKPSTFCRPARHKQDGKGSLNNTCPRSEVVVRGRPRSWRDPCRDPTR